MFDHYYTPRDLPLPKDLVIQDPTAIDMLADYDDPLSALASPSAKPMPPRTTVVDLTALDLDQIAFDCDSDSESGSDDGYVSTLLRIQRTLPAMPVAPRKIAGARRVARAVSSPQPPRSGMMVDVTLQSSTTQRVERSTPEGEVFQSITATPGLEGTSFEELRLETYLQSLIATGTARPQPAFAPALVIPPAFSAPFCEWDKDADKRDIEMGDVSPVPPAPTHPPFVFRAASYPPAHAHTHWA